MSSFSLNDEVAIPKLDKTLDPPLQLHIHASLQHARAATLKLPHGPVRTPVFMPVGTKGTIKGCSSIQLYDPELNPEIILGNTYHLALQVGKLVLCMCICMCICICIYVCGGVGHFTLPNLTSHSQSISVSVSVSVAGY